MNVRAEAKTFRTKQVDDEGDILFSLAIDFPIHLLLTQEFVPQIFVEYLFYSIDYLLRS